MERSEGKVDSSATWQIFAGDLPAPDRPLPRFLDDAAATALLRGARAHEDQLVRLLVETLARTGLRKGELLAFIIDAIVQIGVHHWLRVPVGKLHTDYIPLHPAVKDLLDDRMATRGHTVRSDRLLVERGRPVPPTRIDRAVTDCATRAGLGHVTPHQLGHTLATQAINRGRSLVAIAVPELGNRLALASTADQALAIWADTRAGTEASGKQDLTQAIVAFSGGPAAPSATIAGLGYGGVLVAALGLVLVVVWVW